MMLNTPSLTNGKNLLTVTWSLFLVHAINWDLVCFLSFKVLAGSIRCIHGLIYADVGRSQRKSVGNFVFVPQDIFTEPAAHLKNTLLLQQSMSFRNPVQCYRFYRKLILYIGQTFFQKKNSSFFLWSAFEGVDAAADRQQSNSNYHLVTVYTNTIPNSWS